MASFRVKLVNFLIEQGLFSFLLRSLHFGSNRLKVIKVGKSQILQIFLLKTDINVKQKLFCLLIILF